MLDEKQLEERRSYLGGSDIAAALGESPWATPYELWQNKVHGIEKTRSSHMDRILRIASKQEQLVAELYSDETGHTVYDPARSYTNPKFPWLIANVDRLIKNKNGILECKTASPFNAKDWGEPGTAQIPKYYLLQVATYCMMLEKDFCDVAVLIGNDFRIYTYKRNFAFEQQIVIKTRNFWYNHVMVVDKDGNRLPPVAPPITTKDDIDSIFNTLEGSTLELTGEMLEVFQKYCDVSSKAKELNKEEDELKKHLKLFMGNKEALTYNGDVLLTNKEYERKNVPIDSLKKAYPKIYKELLKHTKYKRFTIK